ncbi:MAG: hypothetical protein RID23_01090 [Roseovarius sp.]
MSFDPAQCPASIAEGRWELNQVPGLTMVDIYREYGFLQLPFPSAAHSDTGTVTVNGCDFGFRMAAVTPDGKTFNFDMQLNDWMREAVRTQTGNDGTSSEVLAGYFRRYVGTANVGGGMSIQMDVNLETAQSGISEMSLSMRAPNTRAQGTLLARMSYLGGPQRRYECRCLPLLEEWIAARVSDAKAFQAAFAEPAYRVHPSLIPPVQPDIQTNWTTQVYDDLIYTMVGQRVSYETAVRAVAETRWPSDEEAIPSTEPAGEESNTQSSARKDMGSCSTEFTFAHAFSCFPDLAMEATRVHEEYHQATGRRMRGDLYRDWDGVMSVEEHAIDEVTAHQVEIEFLEGFVDTYCR